MPIPSSYRYTAHAEKRMLERGITAQQAQECISSHQGRVKQYKGTHGGWVWLHTKVIGNKTLNIVAEIFKKECIFITGYWS